MISLFKEFWLYLVQRKKWWMWMVIVFSLAVGALIFLSQSSAIAPFIYPMF